MRCSSTFSFCEANSFRAARRIWEFCLFIVPSVKGLTWSASVFTSCARGIWSLIFALSLIKERNEFTSSTAISYAGAVPPPSAVVRTSVGSIGPNSAFFVITILSAPSESKVAAL